MQFWEKKNIIREEMANIHIGLCTDERYSMPCGVCLTSIFENNKDVEIAITILTNYLSLKTKKKMKETADRYGQKLRIIEINDSIFDTYPVTEQFQKSIYYRFLFPDLLTDCDKLLYLDVDTIIIKGLQSLYDTDISNYLCGVVIDSACDDIRQINRVSVHGDYFNSGVLLMNLHEWRKQNVARRCMEYLKEFPEKCVYPDQDALNVILDGALIFLPIEYNLQEHFLVEKNELLLRETRWNQIESAIMRTAIIHFSGDLKPWHWECSHPFSSVFDKYKKMSAWSGISKTYKSNKGVTKKIKIMLIWLGIMKFIPNKRMYDSNLCSLFWESSNVPLPEI